MPERKGTISDATLQKFRESMMAEVGNMSSAEPTQLEERVKAGKLRLEVLAQKKGLKPLLSEKFLTVWVPED